MNRSITLLSCFLFAFSLSSSALMAGGNVIEFGGPTMGTSYSVKVFVESEAESPLGDIRMEVDAELRRVNDQMSTYLVSSEVSRFNQSDSTQWFEVSKDVADVVIAALEISSLTDGAFDITVGPLVNAWNFGTTERDDQIPTDEELKTIQRFVGFENLSARSDPPALRKSIPELQIDLSAIAKGHGVDRVVALLNRKGFRNTFVEIGGEVRATGNKAGQWWKVGIQTPDADRDQWSVAHSLSSGYGDDEAIATSGDYRNFIEVDGVRYSHTIDPRTSHPVQHSLASVSVLADNCMRADGWATALNVLGPAGLEVAKREKLSALLMSRTPEGIARSGTGALAAYTTTDDAIASNSSAASAPPVENPVWLIAAITFVAFGMVLTAMAVGVIFRRRPISGSCGGLANKTSEDGTVSCGLCSNPSDACKELRDRMKPSEQTSS